MWRTKFNFKAVILWASCCDVNFAQKSLKVAVYSNKFVTITKEGMNRRRDSHLAIIVPAFVWSEE